MPTLAEKFEKLRAARLAREADLERAVDLTTDPRTNRALPTGADYPPSGGIYETREYHKQRMKYMTVEEVEAQQQMELQYEGGGLVAPMLDPTMIMTGAAGVSLFRSATMGGMSVLNALARSAAVGGSAGVGEAITGIPATMIEDAGYPKTALAVALMGGVASAVTVERFLEKTAFNSINKFNPTFFRDHAKVAVKGSKTKHLSEELLEEAEEYAYKADNGDLKAATDYVELLNKMTYKELDKAQIPHQQAVFALEVPKIKKELSGKVKSLSKLGGKNLTSDDYYDVQRLAKAESYSEAWEGLKEVRRAANSRLAQEEFFEYPHTRMIETIRGYKLSPGVLDSYQVPLPIRKKLKKNYPGLFGKKGIRDISKVLRTFNYDDPAQFFTDIASAPTLKMVARRIANKTANSWNDTFREMWARMALKKEGEYLAKILGEGDGVRSAAIRLKDGTVFEAPTHHLAVEKYDEAGHTIRDWKKLIDDADGFVTDNGRFISRKEAVKLTGQKSEDAADIVGRSLKVTRGKIPKEVPKKLVGQILNDVKALKNSVGLINKAVSRAFKAGDKIGALNARIVEIQKMLSFKSSIKRASNIRTWTNEFRRQIKSKSLPNDYRVQLKELLRPFINVSKYIPDADVSIYRFLQDKAEEGLLAANVLLDGFNEVLPRIANRGKGELKYTDFEKFHQLIKAFHKLGLSETTVGKLAERELIADIVDSFHVTTTKTFGEGGYIYQGRRVRQNPLDVLGQPAKTFLKRNREKVADLFGRYLAHTARMETIVRAIDGFKELGRAWKTIFKPFIGAEALETAMSQKIIKSYQEIFTKHGSAKGKYWEEIFKEGDIRLTKEETITAALHMGNEDNRVVLMHGLSRGKPSLQVEDVEKFIDKVLTKADKRLVEDIWNLLDELYPLTNQTYKEIMGVNLPKVKGRYMPIMQDIEFVDTGKKMTDLFQTTNASYYWASVARNSTLSRKGGASMVRLDLDSVAEHLREVIHLNAYWKPGTEVQKIIKNKDFKTVIEASLGKHIYKQFDPWLKNMMRPSPDGLKLLRQLRANVTVANLGLKFSTAVVQPLSLISSIPKNGLKNTMFAITEFSTNPRQFVNSINAIDPGMANRAMAINRDITEAQLELMGRQKGVYKFLANRRARDFYFSTIRIADQYGSYPAWLAGYRKGMQTFGGDTDKALEFASHSVRTTQPQSMAKDLPRIMRDGEVQRAFTMFYSYFSVLENQIIESIGRYGVKDINLFKLSSDMLYMVMIPALAAHTLRNGKVKDGELLPIVLSHAAGGFPGIRDIASAVTMGYSYQMTPLENVPKEAIRLGAAVMSKMDDDPETNRSLTVPLINTMGYTFGLPTSQALTMIKGLNSTENDLEYTWWDIMVKKREHEDY